MMFRVFRSHKKTVVLPDAPDTLPGFIKPLSADILLASPSRQQLLNRIWQQLSVSREQFLMLYQDPIERYASLVQQFPASKSHHHAQLGGMLEHGLEIMLYALKLRQSSLLPAGTPPEVQSAQADAWTAATAYAALLHDIGKIAVDLHVESADGSIWHPWHGPLQTPYRFSYRADREYRLHNAATGLLYHQILSQPILDWLSDYPTAWSALLYTLAGQYEQAGALSELVIQADRASVAQSLGGNPNKVLTAPQDALQRKLLDGLRFLVREEFKLNQSQASDGWLTRDSLWLVSKTTADKLRAHLLQQGMSGIPHSNTTLFNVLQEHAIVQTTEDDKAIWKASITSENGWSHSFTLLKLSPSLFWQPGERPGAFSGQVIVQQDQPEPQTIESRPQPPMAIKQNPQETLTDSINTLLSLFDPEPDNIDTSSSKREQQTVTSEIELPSSIIETSPGEIYSGEHFVEWLHQALLNKKLNINDAQAMVHTLDNTLFLVTPRLFHRYAQEQGDIKKWEFTQKNFERLNLHRKQPNGLNIWTCKVTGPQKSKRLHGYILLDPTPLFEGPMINNPYLSMLDSSKEVGVTIKPTTA